MILFLNDKRAYVKDIPKAQNEITQFCTIIKKYFDEKSRIVNKLADNKHIREFLKSCTKDTYTVEHKKYEELISILRKTKEDNEEIYLSFIGISCNGDAIDNNGRSRQKECREGMRESYIVSQRAWYIETMNTNNKNIPTITMPYRDTSNSYVISITKEVVDEKGLHVGMVGIDVLIRNIALKLKSRNHIIIVTKTGEIVYNSEPYIRDILEKQYNINLLLGPDTLDYIKRNIIGHRLARIYEQQCLMAHCQLIQDKYYLISIYK